MKMPLLRLFMLAALIAPHAVASSITTTFAGGNEFDGNMFNVNVGANDITVDGLDLNVDGGPMTIGVYIKTGTYVGFDTTPGAWTLISDTVVSGKLSGNQTPVSVTPFSLDANTLYGMYVTIVTNSSDPPDMYYTDGTNTYSNADLTLTTGEGLGGLFGSLGVVEFPLVERHNRLHGFISLWTSLSTRTRVVRPAGACHAGCLGSSPPPTQQRVSRSRNERPAAILNLRCI
jgi:hypothetical protein